TRPGAIERRMRHVAVRLDPARSPVLNVFLPSFDPDVIGGESQDAFWHLVCRLAERGERLRFIATDSAKSSRDWFTYRLGAQPRWLRAFHHQEFVDVSDRSQTLACHPRDICMAASAWSMH